MSGGAPVPAIRHFVRSLAIVYLALCAPAVLMAHTQQVSVQQLLERGALDEAVQRAERERDNPESTYLAAQALTKMDQGGRANEEYARLRDTGDESWKAIGESGALLLEGNVPAAMDAAARAVSANADNPYAHYQVGIVASRQNDFERAAEAFGRSVQLKPDFAYGHYYAGLASQRLKQTPQMSKHLEAFMRLAPEAPERVAVAAILRTLRP
jgi:tetratricopeptide (TPR) repeat protein